MIFLISNFAYSDVDVISEDCDFENKKIKFKIYNNGKNNIEVYAGEFPWDYPLSMNYMFCDGPGFEKCFKNYSILRNVVGEKVEIKPGDYVSDSVSIDVLIGADRLNNEISVIVWGYVVYYFERNEEKKRDFVGVCKKS